MVVVERDKVRTGALRCHPSMFISACSSLSGASLVIGGMSRSTTHSMVEAEGRAVIWDLKHRICVQLGHCIQSPTHLRPRED
jgi:hypothetical protein